MVFLPKVMATVSPENPKTIPGALLDDQNKPPLLPLGRLTPTYDQNDTFFESHRPLYDSSAASALYVLKLYAAASTLVLG
jgi:hypothetical protein